MPQLDPTSFPTQLFWLIVCFVVLYLVMWKVVLPKIADVLRDRQERIDDDLEKAEKLRADAEEVLEAYQKTMADGRSEAQAILRAANEKISEEQAAKQADLSERIARETAEAEARIADAQQQALANIRSVAAEAAQAAAGKLSGNDVSPTEAEAAVGAVMEDRN